jgi:hypothetical protein
VNLKPASQPWLPGTEILQVDVNRILRGAVDTEAIAREIDLMGDYGVVWYHRALISFVIKNNRKLAILEARQAANRGLNIPWLFNTLAALMVLERQPQEAIVWAKKTLDLQPDNTEAGSLLDLAQKQRRASR